MKKTVKKHLAYKIKYILCIVFFMILIISSSICLNKAININDNKIASYSESGTVDYKVRLKDNDFYDHKVLDKGMSYVANLIDKVKVKYNYEFNMDKDTDIDFDYEIVATLKIVNSESKDVFVEKDYSLKKGSTYFENKEVKLKEDVDIYYDEYNEIVKEFKKEFGINTESYLTVKMIVNKTGDFITKNNISSVNDMEVKIPLSVDSVSVNIDIENINHDEVITIEKFKNDHEKYYLISGLVLLIISLLLVMFVTKIIDFSMIKPIKYSDVLKKYLNDYDRFLERASAKIDLNKYDVTILKTFEELLDLQYIYDKNIKYYEINKKELCEFYIVKDKELFLYELKNKNVKK